MFKPHEMGMQVSCRVDSEIPVENTLRSASEEFGGSVARTCPPERKQGFGRTSADGSHPHADIDSSEIFSFTGGWIYKRQERDPYSSNIPRTKEEL